MKKYVLVFLCFLITSCATVYDEDYPLCSIGPPFDGDVFYLGDTIEICASGTGQARPVKEIILYFDSKEIARSKTIVCYDLPTADYSLGTHKIVASAVADFGLFFTISTEAEIWITIEQLLATVTTDMVSLISDSSAVSGGEILDDGGEEITERGVCWSTSPEPDVSDMKTEDGGGSGKYTSILHGLSPNTKYYLRAYATNSKGTGYGQEINFTTTDGDTINPACVDASGNVYYSVVIGSQEWLSENLRTTNYTNGDEIETTLPGNLDLTFANSPRYQWAYNENEENADIYGRLYTWYVINNDRGVCPAGWHVPKNADWDELINYLGGDTIAGGKLKEAGLEHWVEPNAGASNETGFTALGAGFYFPDGTFNSLKERGAFWSATSMFADEEVYYYLLTNADEAMKKFTADKKAGFSVRCIKD